MIYQEVDKKESFQFLIPKIWQSGARIMIYHRNGITPLVMLFKIAIGDKTRFQQTAIKVLTWVIVYHTVYGIKSRPSVLPGEGVTH